MVALDFQDQYWGDIGQHLQIYDFYMALNEPGPKAEILRTLADILDQRDNLKSEACPALEAILEQQANRSYK